MKTCPKVLLTGGTGFLGSHLFSNLLNQNVDLFVLCRKTSSLRRIIQIPGKYTLVYGESVDYNAFFRSEKIDTIVHCATNYGRGNSSISDILEVNLSLPLRLVSIASQFGLRTFINIDTVLPKAVSPYSLSKAQFREWLTSFFHRKLCCVNFALEHFYGPDDERSKFVTWIIYSMLNNVPQLDLTAGEQKRDFIYIDDVVTAFEAVFRKSVTLANGFYSYEVGSGRNIAVSDLVRLIKSEVGNTATELNFGAVPYRTNEEMLSQVNLRNMNSLGWAPNVTLETGIRNVIDFEKRKLK